MFFIYVVFPQTKLIYVYVKSTLKYVKMLEVEQILLESTVKGITVHQSKNKCFWYKAIEKIIFPVGTGFLREQ
jgi:hypothetical protein